LEKLEFIYSVHFDPASQMFGLAYYADKGDAAAIIKTVSDLGKKKNMPYQVEVVDL